MEVNPKTPVVSVSLDRIRDPALRDTLRNLSRQIENVYNSVSKVLNFNLARQVTAPGPTPPFVKDGESILWVRTDIVPNQYYVVSRFGTRLSLWLAETVQTVEVTEPPPETEPPPGGEEPPPDPGTIVPTSLLPQSFTLFEGESQVVTVTISDVSASDIVIPLTNSSPLVLSVPASVTIPSGAVQASFLVGALLAGTSTITATLNGVSVGSNGTVQAVQQGEDEIHPVEGAAVPTFHSIGLYWNPPSDPGARGCPVRYRLNVAGAPWRDGHPLWYDTRSQVFNASHTGTDTYTEPYRARGSLVHLDVDTEYLIHFGMPGATTLDPPVWMAQQVVSTWADTQDWPVASTTQVTPRNTQYTITTSGSPAGYHVHVGDSWVFGVPGGTLIDVAKAAPYNVFINASYIIVRGFTMRGASTDCVRVEPGVTDIVIEDCDMADWGSASGRIFEGGHQDGMAEGRNNDSAVRLRGATRLFGNGNPNPTFDLAIQSKRLVVQRNRMHDPTFGAGSWDYGHPLGPFGVTLENNGGNHVIRYNEIYVTEDTNGVSDITKWFQDGIGGSENFGAFGSVSADSDVYGNRISHTFDDGIETEGGGKNCRVWNNYVDQIGISYASTIVAIGPLYIFRNIVDRARFLYNVGINADGREGGFKSQDRTLNTTGRRFLYHNTFLQRPNPIGGRHLGPGRGIHGGGGTENCSNTVSRNNILHMWRDTAADNTPSIAQVFAPPSNDFNYDLHSGGVPAGYEANGIRGVPMYRPGHGPGADGQYQLADGSLGHDAGARILNFNDGFLGAAPDMGAHEGGSGRMWFGLQAWQNGVK